MKLTGDKLYLHSIIFGVLANFTPICGEERTKEVNDFLIKVFEKLEAYEDTGATPKECLKALEKQIPKPPEYKVHEKYKYLGKNYFCECGVMFVDWERNGTNFCGNCGQKLREVR